MDIRNYFGGGGGAAKRTSTSNVTTTTKGKSALSEIRASKGSPSRSSPRKQRPSVISNRQHFTINSSSDRDSDDENPIPFSSRKSLNVKKKSRVIQLSSSEDELPPSASQARPQKRGVKIESSSNTKSAENDEIQQQHTRKEDANKPTPESEEVQIVESDDDESSFERAPIPAKRPKRIRTPPGQSKLKFSRSSTTSASAQSSNILKDSAKNTRNRPLTKVDATEYFNNFGKTGEEVASEKDQKQHQSITSDTVSSCSHQTTTTSSQKTEATSVEGTQSDHLSDKVASSLSTDDGSTKRVDRQRARNVQKAASSPEESTSIRLSASSPPSNDSADKLVSNESKHSSGQKRRHDAEEGHKKDAKESAAESRIYHRKESPSNKEEKRKAHENATPKKLSPHSNSNTHDRNITIKKEHHEIIAERGMVQSSEKATNGVSTKTKEPIPEKMLKVGADTTKRKPAQESLPSTTSVQSLPWVDKYKPTSLKHLVAQNGEKSPMNKLLGWLRDWSKYHMGDAAKQKKPRPPPWMAQSDGSSFKAVLLSGPPGIGKTTCALLACHELGLQYVEMNASDARNKKFLESKVVDLILCHQMDEYLSGAKSHKVAPQTKLTHVLIMDEVDGMSGNEDRSGLSELIQMIKDTQIPIICICNDRQSSKMRSLVNYCFDVRFQRPRVEQLRSRMQTIAFQEKLKLSKEQIDEVIEASNHDVRQTIYNLQLLSFGGKNADIQGKDCAVNTFEAARRILSADTSMMEKQEMFFTDYSIMPLFVQENYPLIQNSKMTDSQKCLSLRKAADSLSHADIIDRTLRTTGAWSLLNEQALFSSVLPSMYMNGFLKSMLNFPSWLGRNSTYGKRQRLMRQLISHTHLKITADCHSMVTDYVPVLRDRLSRPLIEKETEGVSEVVSMYDEYDLTRDDWEAITELAVWPGMKDPASKIQSKVKAALTRALNKEHRLLPYAVDDNTKGHRRTAGATDVANIEIEIDEEGNLIEVGGDNDLNDNSSDNDSDGDQNGPSKPAASTRGGRGNKTTSGRGNKTTTGRDNKTTTGRGTARGRGRGRGAKS